MHLDGDGESFDLPLFAMTADALTLPVERELAAAHEALAAAHAALNVLLLTPEIALALVGDPMARRQAEKAVHLIKELDRI